MHFRVGGIAGRFGAAKNTNWQKGSRGGLGAKPGARELGLWGLLPGGICRLGRGEGARGASGAAVGGSGGPAH